MKKTDLIDFADYLLKVAINRCDTIADAQDIVQETLLTALLAMEQGKEITNPKAWLVSVLHHKYYDNLRRKYYIPTVSYDVLEDIPVEDTVTDSLEQQEEVDRIRRSLAFLTKLYREVMVRFYMKGESIKQIAQTLDIPENTVKSRLDTGRKHIRKDMGMENYTKQCYEPDTLWIYNSGQMGLNNEPFSLVEADRITMNLLILAYEKPVSVSELAKAIGIATAFVEPIVDRLVRGELMKRISDKVYTDFVIYKEEDRTSNLQLQKELADKHYQEIWKVVEMGLQELWEQDFSIRQSIRQRTKLEAYFAVRTIVTATLNIRDEACGGQEPFEHYPERPNGGKWYAFGNHYEAGYDYSCCPYSKYATSGEAGAGLDHYHGVKSIILREYDSEIGKTHSAYSNREYMKHPMHIEEVLKMLYAIYSDDMKDLESIGKHCVEQTDNFIHIGYLAREEGKIIVDIPVLSRSERITFYKLCQKYTDIIDENFRNKLLPMMKKGAITLPAHLKDVPEWHKYMNCCSAFPMMVIFNAKEAGLFLKDVDYPCPTAFLSVEV